MASGVCTELKPSFEMWDDIISAIPEINPDELESLLCDIAYVKPSKKKRRRPRKRTKNKSGKEQEQNDDNLAIANENSPGNSSKELLEIPISFSIKAIKHQNNAFVFRKQVNKCQLINFEYSLKFDETFIFDSREFVKLNVLNETYTQIDDKTVSGNGTVKENHKTKTNEHTTLQSSSSQAKVKKRRHRDAVKTSKKQESFNEYYSLEDVEQQLRLGELIKGVVRINPKNAKVAYVSNEDRNSQDYIINSELDRNRALDGDVVALKLKPEAEWVDNQKTANVVHILEKVHNRTAIGTLKVVYDKGRRLAVLQPRNKRIPRISILQTSLPPLYFKNPAVYEENLFLAKITEWKQPKFAEGVIVDNLGVKDCLKNETIALLKDNQLDITPFPPSVSKYLPISSAIPEKEFSYREDLRKECIFTIDPLTARDLDDAVSCKPLPNGNLEVGVHIADVAFVLDENTELDEMVAKKGTTIYLVNNVYHMLPLELCAYCSLLPGKDSLTFSVFFEMTPDGDVLSHRFARTIINSCCQLAYEHAQEMIDHPDNFDKSILPDIENGYTSNEVCDIVNKLRRISANLRKKRFDNGALRIDQIKILFKLNAGGQPIEFFKYDNTESHRLIEELMLLANITVARKLLDDFPEIAFLRCHEPPNPRLVGEIQEVLGNVGIHVDVSSPGAIQTSLENYSTPDYFGVARNAVLNHLFAKAMTRARYFCAGVEDYYEHYALSVDTYTHFTSPIRRYADIMVHRLLAASLGYCSKPQWDIDYIQAIAANCNIQKYNAKKAGDASTDLFLAHYVQNKQPFTEDAVVIDVKERAFDVLVLNTGSIVRIFFNKLQEETEYDVCAVGESRKKMFKAVIIHPNKQQQTIEIFQIVKVQLTRKNSSFKLEGQLVQPE